MPRLRVTIHLVKKCTCSGTGGGTEGANGTVGVRTTLSERGRGLRGAAPSPKNTLAVSGTPDRPRGAGSPPASPLSPTRWRRGTEEGLGGSGGRKRRLPRSARLGRKGGRETAPEVAPLGSPQLPSVPLAQWSHGLSGWVRGSALRRLRSRPPASLGRGRTAEGGREGGGRTAGASGSVSGKANSSGGSFVLWSPGAWQGRKGDVRGTQIGRTGSGLYLFFCSAKCRPPA